MQMFFQLNFKGIKNNMHPAVQQAIALKKETEWMYRKVLIGSVLFQRAIYWWKKSGKGPVKPTWMSQEVSKW